MLEDTVEIQLSKKKFTLTPMTLLELQMFEKISNGLKEEKLSAREGINQTVELALRSIQRSDEKCTLDDLRDAVTFRNYTKLLTALLTVSGLVVGEEKPGTTGSGLNGESFMAPSSPQPAIDQKTSTN